MNGSTSAPHAESGAFFVPTAQGSAAPGAVPSGAGAPARPTPQPTVFPPEPTARGWDGLLYHLARAQIAAFPLANWLLGAALLVALLLAVQGGVWPWVGLALAVGAVALRAAVWQARRRDFVHVEPAEFEPPPAAALAARDKLPVYVTGCMEVGNKVRRFALLPGYYRTFATREHALLCLCRGGRRLLLASWPDAEVGLWYAFVQPGRIRRLEAVRLRHGRHSLPALALEIDAEPTRGPVRRRAIERLYISAAPADLLRLYADLLVDAPPTANVPPTLPASTPQPVPATRQEPT